MLMHHHENHGLKQLLEAPWHHSAHHGSVACVMDDMKRPSSGESIRLTIKLQALVGLNKPRDADMERQTPHTKLMSPSVRSMTPKLLLPTSGPLRAFQARAPHKLTNIMIFVLPAMHLNAILRVAPGSLIASHAIKHAPDQTVD